MSVVAGERRIVTVLYTDVVDSTGVGERIGPERSKLLIDEVMRLESEQVERYGGTVAQLAGDSLLAVFGAPVAHEDDSERAVRAGLAIQRAITRYAQEVDAAYGVRLAVRIGVNTGPVLYAEEIEDGADRFNALGETVNVAARLQELATGGVVVVGPETARQVDDCFELETLGAQELRGKAEPVELFRVAGERETDALAPTSPLVGRDFELTVLERTLEGLGEGRGVIVSVMGEPGIGKSRLVWEARNAVRDRIRFAEGRCVSYAEAFPYWPIRDLLRGWLGVGVSTPEARIRLELKAELGQLLGARAEDAYPFLANLLGLGLEPEGSERLRELNRESLQHQTFAVFTDFLRRLSEETPLCLVFEDLHWADDSTLELLEAILPTVEDASIGLFLLYRTEREHRSWRLGELARQRYPHRYRELELRPLAGDASRALAHNAARAELPESVAELLAERAGGNPFFLEEALYDLVERGALRRDNGRLELAVGVDELAVPALVQGALQARLDRLDPGTRELLSVAAVVGRTFGTQLLELLIPAEQLQPALSELQRLDLVVEQRRRPAPEYRFRHGLVQEVAYAQLAEPTRRRLHHRVGDALEELYRDSPEEVYQLLARHFAEADEPVKAADYLLKAGDAARALYADQEAIQHYRRAQLFLARIGDERRERDLLFKIGLAHHLAFAFEEAEAAYDEALACRIEEPPQPEPTERLELARGRPDEIVPGRTYWSEGFFFVEHLFRGLLTVDSQLNVLPSMADNFRVSGDGLTYLFRLREDARWSDGVPLTADDFVFAWDRMREQRTATAFMLEDVERAVARDDRTLEVTLREPRNYFPYTLASGWSFPWPRHKVEELGDAWREPQNLVGNGPFVLSELTDENALLVANPHWGGPRGNIRELDVTFAGAAERSEGWRSGRYDVVESLDPETGDVADTVSQVIPQLALRFVGFRADRPPFSNRHVRRAFALAVDRHRVVESAHWLATPASGGAIPPAMPGHSPGLCAAQDLDEARRLLAEAGYPDGKGLPELELALPTWFDAPGALDALVGPWRELGARIRERFADGHLDDAALEEAHLWVSSWTADFPDPDGFFRGLLQWTHWPFYRDEELLALLAEARSLQDRDERMRLYHEIDRLWVIDRATIAPLAYSRVLVLRRPWVEGVWANPLSRVQLEEAVVTRPE